MRRRSVLKVILFTALAVAAPIALAAPARAAALFGPGPHWVDTVTAGTDVFNSITIVDLDLDDDLVVDTTITLPSPIVVQRGAAADTPDPLDPGHFNHVDIELVSLELTAASPIGSLTLRAGDGVGNLAPDGPLYSPGAIDELIGDVTLADAFLDLFFELETPFGTFHNEDAVRIQGVIDRYPPVLSLDDFTVTPLVDESGSSSTINVVGVSQEVVLPEPAALFLLGVGTIGLVGYGWKHRRKTANGR